MDMEQPTKPPDDSSPKTLAGINNDDLSAAQTSAHVDQDTGPAVESTNGAISVAAAPTPANLAGNPEAPVADENEYVRVIALRSDGRPELDVGTLPTPDTSDAVFTFFKRKHSILIDLSSVNQFVTREDQVDIVKNVMKIETSDLVDISLNTIKRYLIIKLKDEATQLRVHDAMENGAFVWQKHNLTLKGWLCNVRVTSIKIYGISPETSDEDVRTIMSNYGIVKFFRRGHFKEFRGVTDGTATVKMVLNSEDETRFEKLPPYLMFKEAGEIWQFESSVIPRKSCWRCQNQGHIGRFCPLSLRTKSYASRARSKVPESRNQVKPAKAQPTPKEPPQKSPGLENEKTPGSIVEPPQKSPVLETGETSVDAQSESVIEPPQEIPPLENEKASEPTVQPPQETPALEAEESSADGQSSSSVLKIGEGPESRQQGEAASKDVIPNAMTKNLPPKAFTTESSSGDDDMDDGTEDMDTSDKIGDWPAHVDAEQLKNKRSADDDSLDGEFEQVKSKKKSRNSKIPVPNTVGKHPGLPPAFDTRGSSTPLKKK